MESGSQKIINSLNKNIKINQTIKAFKKANKYDIDTYALCVFGNPEETEETMKQTISFVKKLDPTFARVSIFIPYPGTEYWYRWKKEKRILTEDWNLYKFHNNRVPIYNHPNLKTEKIFYYYNLFYKEFYFRLPFILKRTSYGLKHKTLLSDFFYLKKIFEEKIGDKYRC